MIIIIEAGGFQNGEDTRLNVDFIVCCVFEHSIALNLIEDNRKDHLLSSLTNQISSFHIHQTSWKTTE